LLLPFIFRRSNGAANGIVETAQLALSAGVHIAHAADHAVRLIVEIQRIGDQFFDIDFRRPFEAAPIATTPVVSSIAALTTAALASTLRSSTWRTIALRSTAALATLSLLPLLLRGSAPLAALTLWTVALRTLALFAFWTLGGRALGWRLRSLHLRHGRLFLRTAVRPIGAAHFLLCLFGICHPNLYIAR
jgi:hypothetical protein